VSINGLKHVPPPEKNEILALAHSGMLIIIIIIIIIFIRSQSERRDNNKLPRRTAVHN